VVIVSEQDGEAITSGSIPVNCFGGDDGIAWVEYVCTDAPCTVNWYDELGVDLGLTTDTIYNLSAGSYVVGVTNASGCVSYNNVIVSEADEIVIDIAVIDASCSGICDGEASASVTGGVGNLSYLWVPEPATGQGTANVTGLCGGTWNLYVSDENGCMDSVAFDISEIEVIVSNLQITNESCEGDCSGSASVNPSGGSGDYTYFWSPEPANGQGTSSVSGLCGGDYTVEITDANSGCSLSEVFTISQLNPIYLTDSTLVYPECENDNNGGIEAQFDGGVLPYSYQWYFADLSPIAGEVDPIITGLSPGTYIIEVTDDQGCTHSESFVLDAQSLLMADAGPDTSYCGGIGDVTLVGTGNGINSMWMDILGNILTMGDTLTIQSQVGNFGYIFQSSDGICTASDTVYVIAFAQPFADAGPDQDILLEESVQIGGDPTGPGGSILMWSPGETLSDSTIANPIAAPMLTTDYIVYVEDANGCINSDTVTVFIIPEFNPNNGFTPNGDGVNDVWVIGDLTDYPDIEVNIFNRWGQQLFSSKGYSDPWDGKHNGKDLPVGTYYYVIDLNDEDYPDAFTGPLTIMR
jgi:gliding motility-associated-like protein